MTPINLGLYVLNGKTPEPIDDVVTWGLPASIVAQTDVAGSWVSTVFIGVDAVAKIFRRPPRLFETMVFGGPMNHEQRRYETWDQAEAGHVEMVQLVEHANTRANMRIVK